MRVKFLLLILSYLLISSGASAEMTIYFNSPTKFGRVGNTLTVSVFVRSTYQVKTVLAVVGEKSTNLLNSLCKLGTSDFCGSIKLTGLHDADTIDLQVTAVDVQGNEATTTTKFIYDSPPVITIESPLNATVASPFVLLKVKCVDLDSCTIDIMYPERTNYIYSATVKDSLEVTLDLSSFNHKQGTMLIRVQDKADQNRFEFSRRIYVETISSLNEYLVCPTEILDFNYNKVLIGGDSALSYPVLIDAANHQKSVIPLKIKLHYFESDGNFIKANNFVTPYGAILGGSDSSHSDDAPAFSYGFDWNDNVVYSLGALNSSFSGVTAGNYAIWSNDKNLYLRNLQSKSNTLISENAVNWFNDVATNGLAAYFSSDTPHNIYTYFNGVNNKISDFDNKWNMFPVTDRKKVVYFKYNAPGSQPQNWWIYLYDGISNIELADLGPKEPRWYIGSPKYYMINSNYIAFVKKGALGQTQIWLRDSLGSQSQITFFEDNTLIDLLTPKGDIIYTRGEKRYLYLRTGQTIEISPIGKSYYRDSTFYIAMEERYLRLIPIKAPFQLLTRHTLPILTRVTTTGVAS